MSSLARISRIVAKQPQQAWVRFASTQYVPGRKGYAPGFEAPEGTRENTKVIPKRRDLAHLTSHLESTKDKKVAETSSAKKQYRQELKETRHKYARELLEKQGQRQMVSAEKLALTEKKAQLAKEKLENEKRQAQQHQQEVVDMLSLENTSEIRMQDREQKRIENRLALEQAQRDTRRKQLLKLYTSTDSFVTLDNLDAKVDAVMSSEGRSFHEGFNELMHNTSTVQSEIEQRKAQLGEVMGL